MEPVGCAGLLTYVGSNWIFLGEGRKAMKTVVVDKIASVTQACNLKHDHAFLGRDVVRGDAQLVLQVAGLGDRRTSCASPRTTSRPRKAWSWWWKCSPRNPITTRS